MRDRSVFILSFILLCFSCNTRKNIHKGYLDDKYKFHGAKIEYNADHTIKYWKWYLYGLKNSVTIAAYDDSDRFIDFNGIAFFYKKRE